MIQGTLSHYKILQKVGEGGMGEVYSAKDQKLERIVALKILPPDVALDPDRMGRFIREAKAASAINHPNVASVYELNNDADIHFIAMELVEGETLQDRLKRGGPLDHAEILEIAFQASSALSEAHSKGVIHRDLKPVNMMITPSGQLKILDFGLAKMVRNPTDEALLQPLVPQTHSGMLLGTVQYLSPEQALGRQVDGRSDVFSLGIVLYQIATGQLPFHGQNAIEMIQNILHTDPDPPSKLNPEVSSILNHIILKCLQKDAADRYQSAGELQSELKMIVRPSGTARISPLIYAPRLKRTHILFSIALLMGIALLFGWMQWPAKSAGIGSIAVLPFANTNRDTQMEYLSDGITESIINSLSQVPTLKVLARGTVFRYKGKQEDPREVGDALNVDAVVTGSILQHQENLVIRVNLVNVADGVQMWGEQYNRQGKDILQVQSEISKEISDQLRFKLTGEQQKRITRQFTQDTEAYHHFLKGRYFLNKRSEEGFQRAIEQFQIAIDKDPRYSLAYAGLADSYSLMPAWALMTPSVGHSRAQAAAQKAIQLDDSVADAYAALAHTQHNYEWKWVEAETNYKRAISLNPNYATAHHWYASFLSEMGRASEAIPMKKRALDLDPLSLIINADLGFLLYQCDRPDEAILQLKKALELDPMFPISHQWLGIVYEHKKMYNEAIDSFRKASALIPDSPEPKAQLARSLALAGNRPEAEKLLDEIKRSLKEEYVAAFEIALIYSGLGENDLAVEWLQKAFQDRVYQMSSLNVEPRLDSLRSHPGFVKLLRAMNFPQ